MMRRGERVGSTQQRVRRGAPPAAPEGTAMRRLLQKLADALAAAAFAEEGDAETARALVAAPAHVRRPL